MSTPKMMLALCAALVLLPAASRVQAADHQEAPGVLANGALDINDLFVFQSPTNADNAVLVLTVNPFAGIDSPTVFDSEGSLQFQIDNNGDAVTDITFSASFGEADANGVQSFELTRTDSFGTTTLANGSTETATSTSNGGQFQAGLFDDPFFFDETVLTLDPNQFAGADTFAGANVSAIVFELPSNQLLESLDSTNTNVGIQGVTQDGNGDQFDRIGFPAIATVFIEDDDAFNAASPANDVADFTDDVVNGVNFIRDALADLGLNAADDALTPEQIAGALLPDLLPFDTSSSAGFLNGRGLADDVIDAELALISGGAFTSDGIDANDRAFLPVFPFLASPNAVPEPTSAALVLLVAGAVVTRRERRC